MAALEAELLEQFHKLNIVQQKRVLDFAHELTRPKNESGKDFIARTKDIHISASDLEIMLRIAEEDEERIDWDDWNNPPAVFD